MKPKGISDPIVVVSPTGDRVLVGFGLDGNIKDGSANQFEFCDGGHTIRRWGLVPEERLQATKLLQGNLATGSGLNDIDAIICQAEINKRMKYLRKENGSYWEVRDQIRLPFPCQPMFYNKSGEAITSYIIDSNSFGFYWGYFWLMGKHVHQFRGSARIGGRKLEVDE